MKTELTGRGEVISSRSLEVYAHHCEDPENVETTTLIGLKAEPEKSTATIGRNTFERIYAQQPASEIGRPQKALLDVADQITGSILDSGCGPGENALYFVGRGQKVTGIDFLAEPIHLAKRKAAEKVLTATFLVTDALALQKLPEVFENVTHSGRLVPRVFR